MAEGDPFIDYYNSLEVYPDCDLKTLECAYRHLAKKYHPDHAEAADVTKFNEVIAAYRVLRNAERRAEYNVRYADATGFRFFPDKEANEDDRVALSDADAHAEILVFLYKRRREQARDAGVGQYFIQEMLSCSDEHLDFHLWYLRAKGFIETTEQGALAITIDGVDHVISTSRTTMREKLLIPHSLDPND
jgi:curved DNA-binding protein